MARAHGGDGYVVSERLASEVDHRETRQLEPVEPETSSGLCLGAQRITGHQTGLDGQLDHWARPAVDAVGFAREMGSGRVRAMGDVFHMNIEEIDLGMSLQSAGDMLGYVHLADSQRLEPGRGHMPWDSVFTGLSRMGYDGYASLECNLSGPADDVLPQAVQFLRSAIARNDAAARGAVEA